MLFIYNFYRLMNRLIHGTFQSRRGIDISTITIRLNLVLSGLENTTAPPTYRTGSSFARTESKKASIIHYKYLGYNINNFFGIHLDHGLRHGVRGIHCWADMIDLAEG